MKDLTLSGAVLWSGRSGGMVRGSFHFGSYNMDIHAQKKGATADYLIVETAAARGGRLYGDFRKIRTVAVEHGATYRTSRSPGVEVIAEAEVDRRHTGERANYTQQLKAFVADFKTDVAQHEVGRQQAGRQTVPVRHTPAEQGQKPRRAMSL